MPNRQEDVVGGAVVSTGASISQTTAGGGTVVAGQSSSNKVSGGLISVGSGVPTQQEQPENRIEIVDRGTRFKISEFRSEINQNGILVPNRFVAVFSMPKGLTKLRKEYGGEKPSDSGYYTDNDHFLTLRCDNVVVPGVNFFTTKDIKRYGYGQFERRPYLPTFSQGLLRMQFIVDKNAKIIKFFNDWNNSIINFNTDNGMNPSQAKNKPYLLKYKDDFISPTVRIWIYDENNLTAFAVKMYDAYPLAVSDLDFNWATQNTPMMYSVSFVFTHMSMQFLNRDGTAFDSEDKAKIGSTPKSRSEILDNADLEYKTPSFWDTIYAHAEQVVTGQLETAVESYISKTVDNIFR